MDNSGLSTKNILVVRRDLMGIELKKLKNKRSILLIVIVVCVPFIDLVLNWQASYADYYFHKAAYGNVPPSYALHPVAAAFLSGNSIGHLSQMLLLWVLPLFLLLIYSGSVVTEKNKGYLNIIYTKMNKRDYVLNKIGAAFAIGFMVMFISLMLNFGLSNILFSSGSSFGGLETMVGHVHGLFDLSFRYPSLTYFFYVLSTSFIAGTVSAFSVPMAFVFSSTWALYPVIFFVWLLLIINPYSITYAMQPFIEFGIAYILVALALLLGIVLAGGVAAAVYVRSKDVLL